MWIQPVVKEIEVHCNHNIASGKKRKTNQNNKSYIMTVIAPLLCNLAFGSKVCALLLCFLVSVLFRHISFTYLATNTYTFLFYFSPNSILVLLISCFPALALHQCSLNLSVSPFEKGLLQNVRRGIMKINVASCSNNFPLKEGGVMHSPSMMETKFQCVQKGSK